MSDKLIDEITELMKKLDNNQLTNEQLADAMKLITNSPILEMIPILEDIFKDEDVINFTVDHLCTQLPDIEDEDVLKKLLKSAIILYQQFLLVSIKKSVGLGAIDESE